MKLSELIAKGDLKILHAGSALDNPVSGGYASDLLSDVMGHAEQGMVWITLQIHRNVIAVASLRDLAAIIVVGGSEPEPEVLELARAEDVTILSSSEPAFELCCRLGALLKADK